MTSKIEPWVSTSNVGIHAHTYVHTYIHLKKSAHVQERSKMSAGYLEEVSSLPSAGL